MHYLELCKNDEESSEGEYSSTEENETENSERSRTNDSNPAVDVISDHTENSSFSSMQPFLSEDETAGLTKIIRDKPLNLDPEHCGKNVVVVGAGLSGLSCARELKRAGMQVKILEVNSRAGGRCYTVHSPFTNGLYCEAGGMRFSNCHRLLLTYIHMWGLKTSKFNNMKDAKSIFYIDGEIKSVAETLADKNSTASQVLKKWNDSIHHLRDDWRNKRISWEDIVEKYSSYSLIDFLKASNWSPELIDAFSTIGLGLGSCESMLEMSFIEILRLFLLDYEQENLQICGGMDKLVEMFLFDKESSLKEDIVYDSNVTAISYSSNGDAEVTYIDLRTKQEVKLSCEYVVITAPLPAYRDITFTPKLSPRIEAAVNGTHYVRAIKIAIQTKSRFWLKYNIDGMIVSDLSIKNTYFMPAFPGTEKGMIIASYILEQHIEQFTSLTDEQRINKAIEDLSHVFPEINSQFEHGFVVEWSENKLETPSGFAIFHPDEMLKNYFHLRNDIASNVFMAGEHCSVEHGYFEGALESGVRTAAKILGRLTNAVSVKLNPVHWDSKLSRKKNQPLAELKSFDHYTLICENAKEVSDFHVNVLGFKLLRIQRVNSGTVKSDKYDMLNYIVQPPENKDVVCVITEGLNDDTIFRKYLKKHGRGVHHLAFKVDDIENAFKKIRDAGYKTTSDVVIRDKLSGLKQFFIDPSYAGFFIELIERNKSHDEINKEAKTKNGLRKTVSSSLRKIVGRDQKNEAGFFTNDNMASLAQSIGTYVESHTENSNVTVKESEKVGVGVEEKDISPISGKIRMVEVTVASSKESAKFLQNVLGFRLIKAKENEQNFHLSIPGNDAVTFSLQQAQSKEEERKVNVVFAVPEIELEKYKSGSKKADTNLRIRSFKDLQIRLPSLYTSYGLKFVSPSELNASSKVVSETELKLQVQIRRSQKDVLNYLSVPDNLRNWTGHQKIKYSKKRHSWVETRMNIKTKCLEDIPFAVRVFNSSTVLFAWQNGISVKFICDKYLANITSITVELPSNATERRLAQVKDILTIELEILKSILEGNSKYTIASQHWKRIEAYHLGLCGLTVQKHITKKICEKNNFRGMLMSKGSQYEMASTDFALSIRSKPLAVIRPVDVTDVVHAIQMASSEGLKLAARGCHVSHSAGGQAQANKGLVMDMTALNNISITRSADGTKTFARVEAGASWHELITKSLEYGFVPPVTTDYQFLSVGGTISMGGVGFMSHTEGLQADHVDSFQVVTGNGNIHFCSKDINTDLFKYCRAGLGQFGVITELTIPLVSAPKQISIVKMFYLIDDMSEFISDIEMILEEKHNLFEMVHAFIKPCTKPEIEKIIGEGRFMTASAEFKRAIIQGEENRKLVFFLELACYDKNQDIYSKQLEHLKCIGGEYFEERMEYFNYITRDPPVIEINKKQGKNVPHPSMAVTIEKEAAMELIEEYVVSDRGDDHLNEILIMPIKRSSMSDSVPMFPMPAPCSNTPDDLCFFMLFLGSAVPNTPGNILKIRKHHNQLQEIALSMGGKRYSYDTVTASTKGEIVWEKHFGPDTFTKIRQLKRQHDPFHILTPGISMWD